jgi:hypothetical protein
MTPTEMTANIQRARELVRGLPTGPLRATAYSYGDRHIAATCPGVLLGDAQVASLPMHPAERDCIASDQEKRMIREPSTIGERYALLFAESRELLPAFATDLEKALDELRLARSVVEAVRRAQINNRKDGHAENALMDLLEMDLPPKET